MPQTDPLLRAIAALAERRDLPATLAAQAFGQVMAGEASPALMAALLMGLRVKGETAQELQGAALALREVMVRVTPRTAAPLVDTCGTGGGGVGTFNISTTAAFVAAGAGAKVAKHGNRSFSTRSGSADVLEALGVAIDLPPERSAALLEDCGMAFLFAPQYHPAMRHIGPVRRELSLGTIMNLIGPLSNPAGVARQVIGAGDPARAPLLAETLALLGAEHALVVHAPRGLDEIAPPGLGPTDVWEVKGTAVKRWTLDADTFGLAAGDEASLAGGMPADNARMAEAILDGTDRGGRRSAVVLNAAAALVVGGVAKDWPDGVRRAGEALDSGAARRVLERLRRASAPSTSG
ncbi:MAG TPA: anthranilate phosphoribosyltransferase [Gemmatimonadales bacterium]|nr:anthranilate phosphoribosyltransferase [Gemmatimonadales bacterium]